MTESTKHKGGRPRAAEPRNIRVYTKLTAREKELVDARVKRSGMSRSEAIRLLLLHDELPTFYYRGLNPFTSAAFRNLQPLQSNLNQIAHHLNGLAAQGVTPRGRQLDDLVRNVFKHTYKTEELVKRLRHELITSEKTT